MSLAKRIKVVAAVVFAGLALALAATAAPASASPNVSGSDAKAGVVRYTAGGSDSYKIFSTSDGAVHSDSGWLGTCYPQVGSYWGGGWCDGNGPDWHYYGWVHCSNGWNYYGVDRWAGDRRGSYGYCPSGTYAIYGAVYGYHV